MSFREGESILVFLSPVYRRHTLSLPDDQLTNHNRILFYRSVFIFMKHIQSVKHPLTLFYYLWYFYCHNSEQKRLDQFWKSELFIRDIFLEYSRQSSINLLNWSENSLFLWFLSDWEMFTKCLHKLQSFSIYPNKTLTILSFS